MPVCCHCNGSGRCRNCSCSKAGKPCVNCLPQRKGRCRNESHTSSQTPTQPSSQTTPQASNFPSLGSACVGSQDTQPPTQPSPDNEMALETSDQRCMADNSGMSSLTDNNGMLGAGLDFLPVSLPEQQDQQLLPEQQDQQILPEIIPSDQTTPTPETATQPTVYSRAVPKSYSYRNRTEKAKARSMSLTYKEDSTCGTREISNPS